MIMKDTEVNFFAKVTPEEFEDEFLGLEELNRLLAKEADEELTEEVESVPQPALTT